MAERGRCSECLYRWQLRKDGTVQRHYLYGQHMDRKNDKPCAGSGKEPLL